MNSIGNKVFRQAEIKSKRVETISQTIYLPFADKSVSRKVARVATRESVSSGRSLPHQPLRRALVIVRGGVHAGHGVLRGGRRRRCGSPLHDVPDHGGFARLAYVARIADAATAAPVAGGTADATAADATSDATITAAASAAPASAAALCVRGGVAALRGVPLRHRQLLVLNDRQTLNLDLPTEL